jgi:hypothetical protein
VGPGFRLAEQRRATGSAEPPADHVAAVGNTTVISRRTTHGEGRRGKADIDCATTRSEILADAAPAYTSDYRIRRGLVADLSAQTATGNCHAHAPQRFTVTTSGSQKVILRRSELGGDKPMPAQRPSAGMTMRQG